MQQDRERAPAWRKWVRASVIICAVTLVLLEVVLRLCGLTQPVLYEPDEATGFRLKPNQDVRYLGNAITVNQWGVRDVRPLDTKPEGARRVVVLGDSVTWGGIRERQENLFTSVMERTMGEVQVVNAGVNGFSVARMTALYDAHLEGLEPDTVIIYTIATDFLRPDRLKLTGNSVAFPTERPRFAIPVALRLARLLAHQRLGWDWLKPSVAAVVPEGEEDDSRNLRAQNLDSNVEALIAFARSLDSGVRLLVVLAPTLAGDDAEPVWHEVTQTLDASGVQWVKLDTLVKPEAEFFVDGVHLTGEGHRRAGEALCKYLLGEPAGFDEDVGRILMRRSWAPRISFAAHQDAPYAVAPSFLERIAAGGDGPGKWTACWTQIQSMTRCGSSHETRVRRPRATDLRLRPGHRGKVRTVSSPASPKPGVLTVARPVSRPTLSSASRRRGQSEVRNDGSGTGFRILRQIGETHNAFAHKRPHTMLPGSGPTR